MKFFSELGSCWGGAMVSPAAAEAAGDGRKTEEQGGNGGATSKRAAVIAKSSGGAVRHWKPNLNAISEDSPLSEADRGGARRMAGFDDRKRPEKARPRPSPAKAAPPPIHEEDYYWKSSHAMALPAFSPTSYLF